MCILRDRKVQKSKYGEILLLSGTPRWNKKYRKCALTNISATPMVIGNGPPFVLSLFSFPTFHLYLYVYTYCKKKRG